MYAAAEHEEVRLWSDTESGYRGIIAIHSTALGPAVGGTRFWHYDNDELASIDVLRLSRGMSYKNALAGLPFGGGKAVIIGDNQTTDRERIFRAHGRFVETFKGRFITAEDIGTTPADMEFVKHETRHVAGLPGRSGNPSPVTAYGVFRAMQACASHRWGSDSLAGRMIAIQGCGSTGHNLARLLAGAGAKLIVADIDSQRVQTIVDQFDASAVAPEEIFNVRADIFAPCAFGGIINDQTIGNLRVEIVVGAANNQLLEARHGEELADRGILYGPDYVANAGGIINGCRELLGWDESATQEKVHAIYDTMLTLLSEAKLAGLAPFRMADQLAEKLLLKTRDED